MERRLVEIKHQHSYQKRWHRVISMLVAVAAFCTTYALILPALTMSRQLVCGKEEHRHTETCYDEQGTLTCPLEEHTHSEFCYDAGPSDPNADVETQADWEKSLAGAAPTGDRAQDVVAAAMSQLGYQESSRNYQQAEDGTLNGYTRYGAWYGKPYDPWNAVFASFVLHYAGVDDLGRAQDPAVWAAAIAETMPQRYYTAVERPVQAGDLAFMDQNNDGVIDDVGILTDVAEDSWQVIAGDCGDAVALTSYAPYDSRLTAFAALAEDTEPAEDGEAEADPAGEADESTAADADEEAAGPEEKTTAAPTWSSYADSDASTAASNGHIDLSKQIEKTSTDPDDYSYRLHLTMDGSSLSAGSTTTVQPKKRKIGILLDVTETMTSTWSESTSGDNKFDAVRELLLENNGFLDSILDGNTEVHIILVGGASGRVSYKEFSSEIAYGTTLDEFSNIDNSLHKSHTLSYVTGLKAAEEHLEDDIDSLVFIVGNAPKTYVKYSDGEVEMGTTDSASYDKNFADYKTFMEKHPDLSMYMVGIAPVSGGSDTAKQMGEYSEKNHPGGGYYEADSKDKLREDLKQIASEIVVPADKVSGITITDALSEYVTLPDADKVDLSAQLILLNSEGSIKETKNITASITDGGLTCNYTDEISGPFKIEISFNIRTKDGVYSDKYGDTKGDEGTDYGGNTTSSGKDGYYSNGTAKADYTLNGTANSGEFPKPVVQAPDKATIKVKKEWVDADAADMPPVTITLYRGSTGGDPVGTVTLSAENQWSATCDVKILTAEGANNTIYAVETPVVDGFTASYSAENVTVEANRSYDITVTNTRAVRTAKLTVNKNWHGVADGQKATIHVTQGGEELTGSPFTVTSGTDSSQSFTIKWTGNTAPKICVYEDRSDAFYPVFSEDGSDATTSDGLTSRKLTDIKDKGSYTVTLTNMAAVQMPATGGPGTQMYVFSGMALIFGALLLMQIRKRSNEGRAK